MSSLSKTLPAPAPALAVALALALALAFTLSLAGASQARGPAAGPGAGHRGGFGPGPGPQEDPPRPWADHSNVLEGDPFQYAGPVAAVDYRAGGVSLATEHGPEPVHGLGPAWYWELHGLAWPRVGDRLQVEGFAVDHGGQPANLAMAVTTADGRRLELRDPLTGWPLWMQ